MITVVGMGRKKGDLTFDGAEAIKKADVVVVRSRLTHAWSTVQSIRSDALCCDEFYETASDFDSLTKSIVDFLQSFGNKKVVFCVVGDGSQDTACQLLPDCKVVSGVSLYSAVVKNHIPSGCSVYTATDLLLAKRILPCPLVVTALDDKYVASEVQLKLLQAFDFDTPVIITEKTQTKTIALEDLTKQKFDYQTSLLIIPKNLTDRHVFDYYDCADVLAILRSEHGCPWDREQTHKSIIKNCIEEAYELADALQKEDSPHVVEELGDLLMQALFHIEIAFENGEFEPNDVYTGLCRKLIDRHPHVFGEVVATNSTDSLSVWDAQKQKEHKIKNVAENVLDVPRSMSSLMRGQKVQSRASKGGYDFENITQVVNKVNEELSEFLNANSNEKQMEGGDLLFAVVNLLRLSGVDSETALMESTEKFTRRVVECERILSKQEKSLKQLSAEQFDLVWNEAKKNVG